MGSDISLKHTFYQRKQIDPSKKGGLIRHFLKIFAYISNFEGSIHREHEKLQNIFFFKVQYGKYLTN